MILCVDEPSNGVYYGGVVAKPIGERIFSSIFNVKAIKPEDETQLEIKPSIIMPDVEGKTLSEACAELKRLGINVIVDTDGEYVLKQLPEKNTPLYLGEIVYLIVG